MLAVRRVQPRVQTQFRHVGTAIEDFEVKIFDENDREVPRGQWGEIVMRGPGVMKGYWNKPEETAQALRSGWLHSGDIGRMDAEATSIIVDRMKDMINMSGFKVWPAEVEHYLYQIPGRSRKSPSTASPPSTARPSRWRWCRAPARSLVPTM